MPNIVSNPSIGDEQTITRLFEEQAARTPRRSRWFSANKSVPTASSMQWSNRLAHALQSIGVGTETCVGIFMERSLEMVVGMLGDPQGRRRLCSA